MYSVPILKKSLDVLRLLVEEQTPVGVTEIAKRLSISKSTTFGILRALEREGFVAKDTSEKKYLIGLELVAFSKKVIRGVDFIPIARPLVEELVERVGETACISVWEQDDAKVLDVIEAKKAYKISSPIGTRTPITAGVFGKIFLSAKNDEEIRTFLRGTDLARYTENSIVDPERYLEAVRKTREMGYAVDLEEYMKGVRAVATLVCSDNQPVAALWVLGFTSSMNDDRLLELAEQLKRTARQISDRLTSLFAVP